MQDIFFTVSPCKETEGFTAVWDAPGDFGGITTQGETLEDLQEMIRDAVRGWFGYDVVFQLVFAP